MKDLIFSLIGLTAGVLFILALKGLSHPKTARRGNLLGALGATVAIVLVFFQLEEIKNLGWIIGAIAFGTGLYVPAGHFLQLFAETAFVLLWYVPVGHGRGDDSPSSQ